MTDAMAHRGPDGVGHFIEPRDGVCLGHLRLSIIDLSDSAAQPMYDAERRYVMVYNGEIYNYREIKQTLTGYPFITQSDSEVILAAYRQWGLDAFKKLNGIFGIAIWDTLEKRLILVRDHLGVKPVYYAMRPDGIIFASEMKAIIHSGIFNGVLDKNQLPSYLTYQSSPGNDTLIQGIHKLAPGSIMIVDRNGMTVQKYWDIFDKKEFHFENEAQVKQQVREKIMTAVQRQMVADVPVGAFLSGGIDSSILVAGMALQSEQPVNTFTLTFEEKKFDESSYADIVAKKYNTNHHVLSISEKDIIEKIPEIISRMDNPSGDGINSFLVSKAIHEQGLKVAISGLGGDELFAGYGYSKAYQRLIKQNGSWWMSKPLRHLMTSLLRSKQSGQWRKLADLLSVEKPNLDTVYPVLRSVFSAKELYQLTGQSKWKSDFKESLKNKNANRFPPLSQFSLGDITGYTEGVLLKDADQMSMANSLELRVPFFDVDLVEYALAIPDEYKFPSTPKKLLVESMEDLIPESIWNRKKMGFTLPWSVWMKGELRGYCEEALKEVSKRELFNEKFLLSYWSRFLAGDTSVSWLKIWTIVAFEKWYQQMTEINPQRVYA